MRGRPPGRDDGGLVERAMDGVSRLPADEREPGVVRRRSARRVPAGVAEDEQPDSSCRATRAMRSGSFAFQRLLDLHGATRAELPGLVERFVAECRRAGVRRLLIVCGKGSRSRAGQPVLRRELERWLQARAEAGLVSAYHPARPADGGAGAFYVLLRR